MRACVRLSVVWPLLYFRLSSFAQCLSRPVLFTDTNQSPQLISSSFDHLDNWIRHLPSHRHLLLSHHALFLTI
ncbi:hypothetical protein JOL62DRAFT_584035 [Phyllosticta paracitricarpa]|uniref:Secreted protein n=1 Tax=Phyllosticta paracitricarpa TaxID=2016321 RepID=A0ABR1N0C7_9PEZI